MTVVSRADTTAVTEVRAPMPGVGSGEPTPGIGFRAHGHLWSLWDGTPAHAPPGRLTYDEDGRIACHLCGQWFRHLGSHLRRHGWTAERYREAVGLWRREPLCAAVLSDGIAHRQRRRYETDFEVRARFEPGAQLARSGELARLAAEATHSRRLEHRENPELARRRRANLDAGRATRGSRAALRITELVDHHGVLGLAELLRHHYDAGANLESLRELTGLGRAHLRTEMIRAGIRTRPSGHNLPESKHRRAADFDRLTADRVGAEDIYAWLRSHRARGATLTELAGLTGRSPAWVRTRLRAGNTASVPAGSESACPAGSEAERA